MGNIRTGGFGGLGVSGRVDSSGNKWTDGKRSLGDKWTSGEWGLGNAWTGLQWSLEKWNKFSEWIG